MSTETLQKKKYIRELKSITPTNVESRFDYNELFFSITDPKSTITFANETFIHISKYTADETIGQLHKLVRHPDMPRSIFHVFWSYLKQNKPVTAYVKNLSKDGSYYWVLALAFPYENGYTSIRLKPGSSLFTTVQKMYKDVLAYERELESETDKKNAMLASEKYLQELLKKEGFEDYDEFMWVALQKEMHNREQELAKLGTKTNHDSSIIPDSLIAFERILKTFVGFTQKLMQMHEIFDEHSDYILKLARSILLISINAQVSSSKLDQEDLSLSVVAEKMGEQTVSGEQELTTLKENIFSLSELIGTLNFEIISSKLQLEMEIFFKEELAKNATYYSNFLIPAEEATHLLSESYIPRLEIISKGLNDVDSYLNALSSGVKNIERFLMVLRFIHVTGKVEVARMNEKANSFSTTFQELINEISSAETRLKGLSDAISNSRVDFKNITSVKHDLDSMLKQ